MKTLYAFDKYKNKVAFFNADTSIPIPVQLPDGSILFYDRGTSFGEYIINDSGYPERIDGAVDDGSAGSLNWRYLICDSINTSETRGWGPSMTSEGITDTAIGTGLFNTRDMLSKYSDDSSYIWQLVQNRRNTTGGKKWFVPSSKELYLVYQNKDIIVNAGGSPFGDYHYWSSSEKGPLMSYSKDFSTDNQGVSSNKTFAYYCRLLRRI